MGGDATVQQWQDLNAALDAANQVLVAAVPDFDTRGTDLLAGEADLREALTGLASEMQALETDVLSSEKEAVAAAAELATGAHQAADSRLPTLDGHVAEARTRCHQQLTERAAHLEAGLDGLQANGFDAFGAVIVEEETGYDRWTADAEGALAPLCEGLTAALAETTHDVEQGATDIHTEAELVGHQHSDWEGILNGDLDHMDQDVPKQAEARLDGASQSVPAAIRDWAHSIDVEVTAARNVIHDLGTDSGTLVHDESEQARDMVVTAGTALAAADLEFDQSAADAEANDTEVGAIADLRPEIEAADTQVALIRDVLEAAGSQ